MRPRSDAPSAWRISAGTSRSCTGGSSRRTPAGITLRLVPSAMRRRNGTPRTSSRAVWLDLPLSPGSQNSVRAYTTIRRVPGAMNTSASGSTTPATRTGTSGLAPST